MRNWPLERSSRVATYVAGFEPITLLSALSSVTTHIGLVATATTTYNEPFHVARKFASLDHISGGRAGWNLVTSVNIAEAYNFGREKHTEHDARYDRGTEFARIVRGLWDSLGRRCVRARQGERPLLRSGESSSARSQGRAFFRARAAQRAALAAGPADHGAGRHVGCRAGTVGGSRGRGVRHQPDARTRAEFLQVAERAACEIRPRAGRHQGDAGAGAVHRREPAGGRRQIREAAVAGAPGSWACSC